MPPKPRPPPSTPPTAKPSPARPRYALDVVLSPPWVQVDVVGDPAAPPDDRFELRTTDDDTYSQTVPAGGGVASEDRRLLRFIDLVPGRDYALLRHAPGADEPETVFWRRPYADLVNGAHPEADVTPAATFVATQFVWEGGEATPLADCRLYLACERRHPRPGRRRRGPPRTSSSRPTPSTGAGRYGRVSMWPDASTEQDSDAAPPERPADGGGGAAQDRVLLDLGADAWRAAVSEAPLSEAEVATLWSELLDGPAEGRPALDRVQSGAPRRAPRAGCPRPLFASGSNRSPARIYAPRIFGPPRPAPDPIVQVSIEGGVADRARIEVYDGDRLVYAEEHTDRYVTAGEDVWAWDGVGDNGVFDTRRRLRVEVFLHHGGQVTKASQELRTTVGPMDWADLRFDRPSKRADVMFHVDVQNGGIADVTIPLLNGTPIFPRKISSAEFERLKQVVLNGIGYHWSRKGRQALRQRTGSGLYDTFEVHASGLARSREPSLDLDIYVNPRREYARGVNPLLWDPSVFYNEAYFVDRREPAPRLTADADLAVTAAHEVGHTVLLQTQGFRETVTHQGTSTMISQRPRSDAPVPTRIDDDLMKYYQSSPSDSSTFVSPEDARVLCESFYIQISTSRS